MTKGKILRNIEFEPNGITEAQMLEFMKITGELKTKIEPIEESKQKEKKEMV